MDSLNNGEVGFVLVVGLGCAGLSWMRWGWWGLPLLHLDSQVCPRVAGQPKAAQRREGDVALSTL